MSHNTFSSCHLVIAKQITWVHDPKPLHAPIYNKVTFSPFDKNLNNKVLKTNKTMWFGKFVPTPYQTYVMYTTYTMLLPTHELWQLLPSALTPLFRKILHPIANKQTKNQTTSFILHWHVITHKQYLGRFLDIIGREPSVSKTNRLHVDTFQFSFIDSRYVL